MERMILRVKLWVLAAEVGLVLLVLALVAVFAMLGWGMATWKEVAR